MGLVRTQANVASRVAYSQESKQSMPLLEHFKVFQHLFYFNALVPFRLGSDDVKFQNMKCVSIVKAIIFSIINVVITAYLFYSGYATDYGKITTILNSACLLNQLFINVAAYIQCCSHSSNYKILNCKIKDVERTFKETFSRNLPISSLAHQYKLKFMFIYTLFVAKAIAFIYEGWNMSEINGAMNVLGDTVTYTISVLVTLHVVMYVDIVKMFLQELNRRIRDSPICFYSSTKIEFLKNIKFLHMDLWKVVTQINIFFSWSLLLFTINTMINFVYDLYNIFISLEDDNDWSILTIGGNYKITTSAKVPF